MNAAERKTIIGKSNEAMCRSLAHSLPKMLAEILRDMLETVLWHLWPRPARIRHITSILAIPVSHRDAIVRKCLCHEALDALEIARRSRIIDDQAQIWPPIDSEP